MLELEIAKYLKARFVSEKAQGMIEYALIAAFICGVAATIFAANGSFSSAINTAFGSVSNAASNAASKTQS